MNTTPLRSLDDVLEAVGRMPSLAGWRWRAVAVWTLLLLASGVVVSQLPTHDGLSGPLGTTALRTWPTACALTTPV